MMINRPLDITHEKMMTHPSELTIPMEADFLGALEVGFNDMGDGDQFDWNQELARRFTEDVFRNAKGNVIYFLPSAKIQEKIKNLAIAGTYDWNFCRRAAYWIFCTEIANDQEKRTKTWTAVQHFWNNPETDMEPWR